MVLREVMVGDRFLDGGESVAGAFSLQEAMVWILVRLH